MSTARGARSFDRALRWYPAAWRSRYGSELTALLEDTYGQSLPWQCKLSLCREGLAERLRPPGPGTREGVRAGWLLALWAWAVFVLAGGGFVNLTDNWRSAAPAGGVSLAGFGYDLACLAGVAGCVIVTAGMAVCLPAAARFLRSGGWREVRWHAAAIAASLATTILLVTVMAEWARHLTLRQRSGGLASYSALALAVVAATAVTVILLTATTVTIIHRAELPLRAVRCCGFLAFALAAMMSAVAAGATTWCAGMAARVPWFVAGSAPGTDRHGVSPIVLLIAVLMTLGLLLAGTGARRAASSLRSL